MRAIHQIAWVSVKIETWLASAHRGQESTLRALYFWHAYTVDTPTVSLRLLAEDGIVGMRNLNQACGGQQCNECYFFHFGFL